MQPCNCRLVPLPALGWYLRVINHCKATARVYRLLFFQALPLNSVFYLDELLTGVLPEVLLKMSILNHFMWLYRSAVISSVVQLTAFSASPCKYLQKCFLLLKGLKAAHVLQCRQWANTTGFSFLQAETIKTRSY